MSQRHQQESEVDQSSSDSANCTKRIQTVSTSSIYNCDVQLHYPIMLQECNAPSHRGSMYSSPLLAYAEVVARGGQSSKSVVDSKLLSAVSLQQESAKEVDEKLPLRVSKSCRESEWLR